MFIMQIKDFLVYHILILCIAFILDLIFGDPIYGFHPVRLYGRLIAFLENLFRKNFAKKIYKLAGFLLMFFSVLIVGFIYFFIACITFFVSKILYIIVMSVLLYQLIACKSLMKESMKVYYALKEDDIQKARDCLSMIVGRDTKVLDREGIIKADIETIAENFSDGVVAPILVYLFLGIVGVAIYKMINTLDSMIGYKDEKYKDIGYFSAKFDDVLNFIPARISALLLLFTSLFIRGMSLKNGIKIFLRDRYKHASPNSAQTESVVAGLLKIRLAGNAVYFGKVYKKEYIGDFYRKPNIEDIYLTNKLMLFSSMNLIILSIFFSLLIFIYM